MPIHNKLQTSQPFLAQVHNWNMYNRNFYDLNLNTSSCFLLTKFSFLRSFFINQGQWSITCPCFEPPGRRWYWLQADVLNLETRHDGFWHLSACTVLCAVCKQKTVVIKPSFAPDPQTPPYILFPCLLNSLVLTELPTSSPYATDSALLFIIMSGEVLRT